MEEGRMRWGYRRGVVKERGQRWWKELGLKSGLGFRTLKECMGEGD